jgi:hypothetical protein
MAGPLRLRTPLIFLRRIEIAERSSMLRQSRVQRRVYVDGAASARIPVLRALPYPMVGADTMHFCSRYRQLMHRHTAYAPRGFRGASPGLHGNGYLMHPNVGQQSTHLRWRSHEARLPERNRRETRDVRSRRRCRLSDLLTALN